MARFLVKHQKLPVSSCLNLARRFRFFPVQIVESIGEVIIFLVLMFIIPMKRAHGQIVLLYLILYSIMRSFTETFRGDTARGFVIENVLSTSQFISLLISIAALLMIVALSYKQNKRIGHV